MTESNIDDPETLRIPNVESAIIGSLRRSSSCGKSLLDVNASVHIRTDFLAPNASFRNETEDKREAAISGFMDSSHLTTACAHAQQHFELDFSTGQIKDLSQTYPAFRESEVHIGRFLGRGSTGQVNQVCGFRIKEPTIGDRVDTCSGKESGREFIINHCYRESGDARYAIKYLRKELIKDPKVLIQAMADLNLETRFLSHLTANPHPNIIKLRAVASGFRFSPNYFILIDRLYDTLEVRLDKWVDKAKRIDSPILCLKAILERPNKVFSRNYDPCLLRERSVLLYDQLRAVAGLSSAIAHMHKHGLMHRDIKSANMGFNIRDDIKLFDLALAREIPCTMDHDGKSTTSVWKFTQMVGTPRYMAPEVALGWCYNEKCDVFSFGIVMWQIMGLQTNPYGTSPRRNNVQFFTKAVWQGTTVRPSMRFKKRTSQIHFSPEIQQLVTSCWSHRWQDRPPMVMVEATLSDLIESRNRSEKTVATVSMVEEQSLPYDSPSESSGGPISKVSPLPSSTSSRSPRRNLRGWLSRPLPGKSDETTAI